MSVDEIVDKLLPDFIGQPHVGILFAILSEPPDLMVNLAYRTLADVQIRRKMKFIHMAIVKGPRVDSLRANNKITRATCK